MRPFGAPAYDRPMHLRRALLLMGLVLLVVAAVESLAPVPHATVDQPAAPPSPAAAAPTRTLAFAFPRPPRGAPDVSVAAGTHATVQVRSVRAGQVTLAGLGLSGSVEPSTPATFDVLADRAGAYDVTLTPVGGAPLRVGRLLVK